MRANSDSAHLPPHENFLIDLRPLGRGKQATREILRKFLSHFAGPCRYTTWQVHPTIGRGAPEHARNPRRQRPRTKFAGGQAHARTVGDFPKVFRYLRRNSALPPRPRFWAWLPCRSQARRRPNRRRMPAKLVGPTRRPHRPARQIPWPGRAPCSQSSSPASMPTAPARPDAFARLTSEATDGGRVDADRLPVGATKNGTTTSSSRPAAQTAKVPSSVKDFDKPQPVSFRHD